MRRVYLSVVAAVGRAASGSGSGGLLGGDMADDPGMSLKETMDKIREEDVHRMDPIEAALSAAPKTGNKKPVADEIDTSELLGDLRNQTRGSTGMAPRRKRAMSMDDVLGDVLTEAMKQKDQGVKPDMEFIYKTTQERIYEAEHGRKPPSGNTEQIQKKYLPFPPDLNMTRLEPNACLPIEDDPWPIRAITLSNPVLSRADADRKEAWQQSERERRKRAGNPVRADEEEFWTDHQRMYLPREGFDLVSEFTDAIDEHFHWEQEYVRFIREAPLWQRRSLPLLHEHYRTVSHRLVRAEIRFIACRDKALASIKGSSSLYKRTEDRIDRSRMICADTHKSLSSPNYDPIRMKKKSFAGHLMSLSEKEYKDWIEEERTRKNSLIAEMA